MKKNMLLSIIALIFLFTQQISAQVNVQDSLILIDLMNSMEIQVWNTDKQVYRWAGIDVTGNRVTNISLHKYYYLKGSIPSSIGNLTALTKLEIADGDLSGEIPESIGNLTALTELKLIGNNLSGEIPASLGNLTALTTLILNDNNLTGKIPPSICNLSTLTTLYLLWNNLSGEIPPEIGNLTSIISINLDGNNLTGKIPSEIGNLTSIKSIKLSDNKLSGEIPVKIGDLENLTRFHAHHNNISGKIPKELFNCNKLFSLNIAVNNLTDSIPSEIGNLTLLDYLDLSNNDLKGEVPSEIENLVVLRTLLLQNNQLEVCTKLPKSINRRLDLQNNRFNFDDLKPFANQTISDFRYAPQDTIVLEKKIIGDETKLSMDAGGTKTTYQWFYDKVKISGATDNEITISTDKEIQKYHCEAKNTLLPELTLIGHFQEKEEKDCWQAGQLKFCLSSGKWEGVDGEDKIKTTNLLSINDFLFFDGTMTIDTTKLELEASGEFYFDNIPIPGGGFGKYTLLKGEHKLTLIGNEGKIMDFLNSGLSKTASLFGAQLKIDDLQFFRRQDTLGVRVGCSVKIPWVSESCGISNLFTLTGIDLKLKNLEITNKGIMSAGFEVENLGLFKEGHCLNKIDFEYDWKRDIMTAGADIALPFIKVDLGGGFKLEKGEIDSVAWSVEYLPGDEDKKKAIPIGFYTLGVKGFSGHISGLNQPGEFNPLNMSFELAGTFSDITSEKWYRLEGKGHTIWPKEFNIKGEGQFLKPMDGIPYQLKGDTEMSYNVSENWIYMGFDGQCVPIDEEIWLIDGFGCFNLTLDKYLIPRFSGNIGGLLTLPKLENNWFFNWLNMIFDFPITLHSNNKFNDKYLNLIQGSASIETAELDSFSIRYVVDLYKNWNQSGFFQVVDDKLSTKSAFVKEDGVIIASNSTIFNVPENNSFGVIEIKSENTIPVSSITSPLGKIYSESVGEDNILYTESEDGKEAFWTLVESTPGDWTITLENPAQTDSIITHFQLKDQEFNITTIQTGNTVTVNWDVSQVKSGQTVNILLDTDNANFDGFIIKDEDATVGNVSFVLDEKHPGCKYYLYAQLIDEFSIVESYADDIIENPLASLATPQNFNSQYNTETGELEFDWNVSPSSEIYGYILSVTDVLGNDSVYAILSSNQTSISLFIEDFETKSVKIESFNHEWKIGCPATINKLTTSIDDIFQIEKGLNTIKVYPNPTSGNLTIRYYVAEPSKCEIRIYNIDGREIAQPLTGFQPAGFYQFDFQYKNLPDGMYLIKYVNNNQSVTIKSVLSK